MNLYNEIDPYAAEWLENLIINGSIADGSVDRRSIKELKAEDLEDVHQFHAFAGIGVWSYALHLAGWPDSVPVWTGSCPCQPFSVAGRQEGITDERHLWPYWVKLIAQCRPAIIFGEQVASPDGRVWLDDVSFDLEILGYEVGRADLCAAGIGAPHIRQRLFFCGVADSGSERLKRLRLQLRQRMQGPEMPEAGGRGEACGVAHHFDKGPCQGEGQVCGRDYLHAPTNASIAGGLAHSPDSTEQPGVPRSVVGEFSRSTGEMQAQHGDPGPANGFWREADWLFCRDGKWRPVEPDTFPLANGAPKRVGRLRAYGNAIVSWVAATFIASVMDILEG